jgi:hypothetical protein
MAAKRPREDSIKDNRDIQDIQNNIFSVSAARSDENRDLYVTIKLARDPIALWQSLAAMFPNTTALFLSADNMGSSGQPFAELFPKLDEIFIHCSVSYTCRLVRPEGRGPWKTVTYLLRTGAKQVIRMPPIERLQLTTLGRTDIHSVSSALQYVKMDTVGSVTVLSSAISVLDADKEKFGDKLVVDVQPALHQYTDGEGWETKERECLVGAFSYDEVKLPLEGADVPPLPESMLKRLAALLM